MLSESESAAHCRERLSAMADGELDAPGSGAACDGWRADAELRRDWHAWHLIGDVLRSDDLACESARDLRLLAVVRERLASEPVVLAPSPMLAAASRSGSLASLAGQWRVPGAVAAGLVLVVGTFMVTRPSDPGASLPGQAMVVADGSDARNLGAADSRVADAGFRPTGAGGLARGDAGNRIAQAPVLDRKMIRDARLDRYLDAHKQFAGTSALGVPSAFLSGATVDSSSR